MNKAGAISSVVILVIGVAVGWMFRESRWFVNLHAQSPSLNSTTTKDQPTISSSPLDGVPSGYLQEEENNIWVYEKCNRGVVNISTRSLKNDAFLSISIAEGSGSGSVIDKQGFILTNYHVVEGAREISVTLFNGVPYPAQVVGLDPDNDIAVLKIEAPAENLVPIEWGDATGLRVGQRILAIGNPFGLERTLSDGIVSSLNRQIPSRNRRTMKSIIQIDASLNQGNSGGPLLNTRGELIGMNTAIATSTGDNAGIGFSIPVNTLRRVVPELITNGRVIRPTIGIERVFESSDGSLQVVHVTPGGPADQAGLKGFRIVRRTFEQGGYTFQQESVDQSSADIILTVDNQKVSTADDLLTIIEQKRSGDSVELVVLRGGKQQKLKVILGSAE